MIVLTYSIGGYKMENLTEEEKKSVIKKIVVSIILLIIIIIIGILLWHYKFNNIWCIN